MRLNSYKDLIVWQKAMDMSVNIYHLARMLPLEERYALSDQMRRAAVSVPSNIAEGYTRKSTKDYVRILNIANGSKAELETQLELCERLGYLSKENIAPASFLLEEIGKMLESIIRKLTPPKS